MNVQHTVKGETRSYVLRRARRLPPQADQGFIVNGTPRGCIMLIHVRGQVGWDAKTYNDGQYVGFGLSPVMALMDALSEIRKN